jgi:hypothetical protein
LPGEALDLHQQGRLAEALYNQGIDLKKSGRLTEAAASFGRAAAMAPGDRDIHFNLGNTLSELGETKAAIQAYRSAVAIDPDFFGALYNLAQGLKAQGRLNQAAEFYGRAIDAEPDRLLPRLNLAGIYEALGDAVGALRTYRKAKEVEVVHGKPQCLLKVLSFFGANHPSPVTLFLGDSTLQAISNHDNDRRCLGEMLDEAVPCQLGLARISRDGYHPGIFWMITHTLAALKRFPKYIVLPINMRSFSPQWDLHPVHQHVREVVEIRDWLGRSGYAANELKGIDQQTSNDDYLSTRVNYPLTDLTRIEQFIRIELSRPKTDKEKHERWRQLFIFNQLHPLAPTHRKFCMIEKAVQMLRLGGVRLLCYITPINVEAGERFVGLEFKRLFQKNVALTVGRLQQAGGDKIRIYDWSMCFGSNRFTFAEDRSEHLNQYGRLQLTRMIVESLLDASKGGHEEP